MQNNSGTLSLSDILIHKEKKQKKNNKTNGQLDKLKKYTNSDNKSNNNAATVDKQIKREAKFIKNIHIDDTLQRLKSANLLLDNYEAWYCKCLHTLGVSFVTAQADKALNLGKNPQALFHFLLNKGMNKATDKHLPRFN